MGLLLVALVALSTSGFLQFRNQAGSQVDPGYAVRGLPYWYITHATRADPVAAAQRPNYGLIVRGGDDTAADGPDWRDNLSSSALIGLLAVGGTGLAVVGLALLTARTR